MSAVTRSSVLVRKAWIRAGAGAVVTLASAVLAGCTLGIGPQVPGASQSTGCRATVAALPASQATSLIALVPRTSARDAAWGLRELARLLPALARSGIELHVLYTQDRDDLGESGGDGETPQVMLTKAPAFPAYRSLGMPQSPSNPTSLTRRMYCDKLLAWSKRASQAARAQAASRDGAVTAWADATAARLRALAGRPVPDTTGTESGVEIDANGSIFAAAQVAPRASILFLGGLTALRPPSREFRFAARLVALVRSSDPAEVLRSEAAWSKWAKHAGGSFLAMSSNDTSAAIAKALAG